jgi:6-phosphogluconolactonase/glucosamine-6-phosphate isomerase/deaminase
VPEEAFGERLAIHTTTDAFAVRDRITLTIAPLHAARAQCFFLNGDAKKRVWNEMMESTDGPRRWPAKGIMAEGETTVIVRS